jgi:hypothetical protein
MILLMVLLMPMVSLPAGSLRDDLVPPQVFSHASSCIPPISPTAELSDLVNSLLPPAGNPLYQFHLRSLHHFFQNRGIRRDTMQGVLTGISEEALNALFDVPAARFADITRIINDLMLAPVNGVMGNTPR